MTDTPKPPDPDLNLHLLALGQPYFAEDQLAAVRGIAIAFIISAPFIIALGWLIEIWWNVL